MIAVVHVGATRVGVLERDAAGDAVFRFDVSYVNRPDRPVLGRHFEELELDPDREHVGPGGSLHPFFRNALPEGALRKWLEDRLGRGKASELAMLLRLGEDLPGALRVVAAEGVQPESSAVHVDAVSGMRFSLAGMNMKASVVAKGERLTLPMVGETGSWIAKFPSARFECTVPAKSRHSASRKWGVMAPVSRVPRVVDGVQDERASRDASGVPGLRRRRAAWWRSWAQGQACAVGARRRAPSRRTGWATRVFTLRAPRWSA